MKNIHDLIEAVRSDAEKASVHITAFYIPITDRPTWLYIETDQGIGYAQIGEYEAPAYSTVHMPNIHVGTGFSARGIGESFAIIPGWADERNRAHVKKYRDMEHYFSFPRNQIIKYEKVI